MPRTPGAARRDPGRNTRNAAGGRRRHVAQACTHSRRACGINAWMPANNPLNFHVRAGMRPAPADGPRRTQQIMLRRLPKTVDSYREGGPNRDNRHFGDA
ncbi:hypothetical protein A8D79_24590 [Burkholderia cenocepacia]|nr:hypothetical protein A8D79_24590 [Burkholderia cenocepacia]ONU12963.1 hypothetical protein A8E48_33760 [Burkholderia cenocepacia]